VTNWGGRRPRAGDRTSDSSGTQAVVDERGIAASGTVSVVDLRQKKQVSEISVGLSPCDIELSGDGRTLYVAAANSDTVSVIDVAAAKVAETITTRVDDKLPFGAMPNGLALSGDGKTLLVSLAGNNAIALVRLGAKPEIAGFIPTGWYPGGIVERDRQLYVANIKGVGSRTEREKNKGWNSHWHRGTLTRVDLPDEATLAKYTEQVRRESRVPQILKSIELADARKDAKPAPVPANVGEPSVFEHIVYIIKENRTYDQIFGAIGKGNGDPKLCVFGREITPNHHALAEQFVLLDNFYCNGVLSADGHSWATEGNVTPYLERSFGGFNRSYTFGDDPLTYSSSGFVWDHVLAKGLSFRNYGEFDEASMEPKSDYPTVLKDWEEKTGKIRFKQKIGVEKVRKYTCPDYPGWNMDIPDKVRADVFLREFAEFEKNGLWPNFVIAYLPNDHTSGTGEGVPTPRSLVADNDLALGRMVEAVSKSRYWPKTCIFVIEDDPQNGFDHVDGHRSTCLVISPYTKRGEIVSKFYNQASVIHTMERIFGIAAHNQLYALAPIMFDCFADTPDLTAYNCRPSNIKLAEMNPRASTLPPRERALAEASAKLPLDKPDRCDEDTLNRIVWHAMKGADASYPAEWAGAHGRGLEKLGLKLDPLGGLEEGEDDDDDD
jgi:YVTN family beta-propeller protein